MKKIIKIGMIFLFVFLINSKIKAEVICKITLPKEQGVSEESYLFQIEKLQNPITKKFEMYYTVQYESTIKEGGLLKNLFAEGSNAVNLGNKSGLDDFFSDSKITSITPSTGCPKYVWIGPKTGYKVKKYGLVFSNQAPATQTVIGDYYNSYADNQERTMSDKEYIDKTIDEYNQLYSKLDGLIEDIYAKRCSELEENLTNIGRFEGILANYQEYLNKDQGEDLKRRLNLALGYCRSEGYDVESQNPEYEPGDIITGCEVIPEVVRKWINNILNFVRYIALILVVILGTIDFIKAAASGEPDAMKKAGQSFMKRMIAVVILFLLPVIVDFILNMINIYGVDTNNIDCL